MDTVYLNGQLINKNNATISIMDRGFLFGDSVYEVIPVHNNHLVGGQQHFLRLQQSLENILIDCPFSSYENFVEICHQLVTANHLDEQDCSLYFQISRGTEDVRLHRIPEGLTPTVVAFCMPLKAKTEAELKQGFKAITHNDLRHDRNFIKSTTLLTNVMLLKKAHEKDALETILLRDGKVLECTASNLFIVKDGIIKTPPLSDTILAGVTRELILQFAREAQIAHEEVDISEEQLRCADEIWVTGSSKEVCPIVILDGQPVGEGSVGPMWSRIHELYQQFKEQS